MEICYKPIGYVRVNASDEEVKKLWDKGLISTIEILPEYSEALEGLNGFSHIIVIYHMHKVTEEQRRTLKVKPRRLLAYGFSLNELPTVGVFATDSPHRPNPIGLSIVEVVAIEGLRLKVKYLDAYDGTPVLDIKPYTPARIVKIRSLPEWYVRLWSKARERGLVGEI